MDGRRAATEGEWRGQQARKERDPETQHPDAEALARLVVEEQEGLAWKQVGLGLDAAGAAQQPGNVVEVEEPAGDEAPDHEGGDEPAT
jgi:hypothetical protein